MSEIITGYRRPAPEHQPPYNAPDYGSTRLRHPQQPLLQVPHTLTETSSPASRRSVIRKPRI
ncbi:hypothetical protein ACFQU7_27610 [Pseudoroseomonas wenyumeiae]